MLDNRVRERPISRGNGPGRTPSACWPVANKTPTKLRLGGAGPPPLGGGRGPLPPPWPGERKRMFSKPWEGLLETEHSLTGGRKAASARLFGRFWPPCSAAGQSCPGWARMRRGRLGLLPSRRQAATTGQLSVVRSEVRTIGAGSWASWRTFLTISSGIAKRPGQRGQKAGLGGSAAPPSLTQNTLGQRMPIAAVRPPVVRRRRE